MTRKKNFIALIAVFLVLTMSLAAFFPMAYAWFVNPTRSNANVGGNIKGSYFEDGDGTKNNPYIIARPIQLYYLAWLQNIGYFNRESSKAGEEGTVRQFYFQMQGFDYQRNGISSDGTVKDGIFDMSSYRLPPIGTTQYPFVGYFDGNGCVIDGLTVINQFIESDNAPKESTPTVGTQALGFFGVVGTYNGTAGTLGTGVDALTYDTDDNEVTNFILSGLTVDSQDPNGNQTLVGLAAGYVNGSVTKVGVSDGTITVGLTEAGVMGPIAEVGNGNESDFGLVGYCTAEFKQTLQVEKVTVTTPTYTQNVLYKNTQQEGAGFGGSIQMKNLFNRLTAIRSASGSNSTYVTSETVTIDEVNGTRAVSQQTSSTIFRTKTYDSTAGSFSFSKYSSSAEGGNNTNIVYLMGKDGTYTKTVTTITKKNEYKNGYIISSGSNYLNNNGTSGVTRGTSAETATSWAFENNRLFFYTSDGYTYYLNATTSLALSTTASTSWTKNNDNTLSYSYGGLTWYLCFDSATNEWSVYPAKQTYLFSNGTYYLNAASTTTVNGGTVAGSATEWIWDETNGRIYTYYSNSYRYLNATDSLSLSTSATTVWTKNDDNTFSYNNNGVTWYLRCVNGTWSVFPAKNTYRIFDGSNYLNLASATTVTGGTDAASATEWAWDASGHLFTYYNGNYRYLTATDSISLSTTPSTVWTHNNNGTLTYSHGGQTWYLYDQNGTWTVHPASAVQLVSQNGVYLNIASTSAVSGGNDATSATEWIWDGTNGRLSTYYSGDTYYLNASGSNVTVSTSATTTWARGGDGALTSGGNYLFYNGAWTMLSSDTTFYLIKSGSDYLSNSGTTLRNGDVSTATYWLKDGNGRFYTTVNSTPYYLRAQTTRISLNATQANGTVFTYDSVNHRMTCTLSGNTYYLVYRAYDETWTVRNTAIGNQTLFISTVSGNTTYYLNASTSAVSTGTAQESATEWIYNGSSGTISTVISGTTYYLRAALETNNTRASTNLTVTATAGQATTFSYSANHLTCTLSAGGSNRTYSLALDNNTLKMVDTGKTYYTIKNRASNYFLNADSTNIARANVEASATLWEFSNDASPSSSNSTTTTVTTLINGARYYLRLYNSFSLSTTSQNLQYYNYSSYYYLRYNSGNTTRYLRDNSGWTTRNSRNDNDRITRTAVSFTAATIDLTAAVSYITDQETQVVGSSAGNTFTELTAANITFPAWNSASAITLTPKKNATLTLTDKQVQIITRAVTTESSDYPADTYIPLSVNGTDSFNANTDSVEATGNNTGYIVSGSTYHATGENAFPYRSGDIRVSQYPMSYLYRSLTTNNSTPTNFNYNSTYDSRLEVITAVNHGDYSGFYRVSDSYNKNNTTINSTMSNAVANNRKISYTDLGLKRYEDARASLSETFLNQNNICGLHFMNAAIGTSIVTVPQAIINGEEISNLTVPSDCIDFNVKNRGFLTIFAGTYFSGNTAFFSLHEIFRYQADDAEVLAGTKQVNDIKEIKEISKIYQPLSGTNDYIYRYDDGSYSKSLTSSQISSLVLAFDMDWMTNTSVWVNNAVYYFEIPVNSGEFALGSVEGKDGAYLFYLDIAANGGAAEDRDRVTVAEQFTTSTNAFTAPKGVQLIDFDASTAVADTNTGADGQVIAFKPITNAVDYLESVAVRLKSGYTGTYPFTRDGTEFSYLLDGNAELGFVGGSLTAVSTDGAAQNPTVGNYTIGGHTVRLVETITDTGRDTSVTDVMRVETVDVYNANGVQTSREVTIWAGLESESNVSNLLKIASFTYRILGDGDAVLDYTDAAYDDIVMRVVRGSTIGGFNVSFDRKVKVTSTFCHESGHINFGDNTANVLIALTNTDALTDKTVPAVNLALENLIMGIAPYRKSTVGDDLMSYYYYKDPAATVEANTTAAFTPANLTSASTAQTLAYDVAFTSTAAIDVYATLLKDISQPYVATVWVKNSDETNTEQKNITTTVSAVTVNTSNALTTKDVTVKYTIAATPGG